jgi:hypothetical protein
MRAGVLGQGCESFVRAGDDGVETFDLGRLVSLAGEQRGELLLESYSSILDVCEFPFGVGEWGGRGR